MLEGDLPLDRWSSTAEDHHLRFTGSSSPQKLGPGAARAALIGIEVAERHQRLNQHKTVEQEANQSPAVNRPASTSAHKQSTITTALKPISRHRSQQRLCQGTL